ncbi:MAG: aconitase family protein [Sandaracinus sp.]
MGTCACLRARPPRSSWSPRPPSTDANAVDVRACINAGLGVSDKAERVTVSAINRNFPGRSGPGKVYLASPLTVAASAIAGKIVDPAKLLAEL